MKSPVAVRRLSVFAYVFLVIAVPASALWSAESQGGAAATLSSAPMAMTSATLLDVAAPSPWLVVTAGLLMVSLTVLNRLRKAPLFARTASLRPSR